MFRVASASARALRPAGAIRRYSILDTAKNLNKKLNRIGDENSPESQKTMRLLRKTGGISIIVVFCSIMWASTLNEPVVEEAEVPDLSKDIRNLYQDKS